MGASPIGLVVVTAADRAAATLRRGGTNPSAREAGTSPFRGGFWGGGSSFKRFHAQSAHFTRRAFPPLSTGPALKTERFQRGRSCGTEGIPFGAPLRGSTDARYLSEGGPGAGAPHGILAGPRQPLVPFPCGKGTRASADARNSLKPHLDLRLCAAAPHSRTPQRSRRLCQPP